MTSLRNLSRNCLSHSACPETRPGSAACQRHPEERELAAWLSLTVPLVRRRQAGFKVKEVPHDARSQRSREGTHPVVTADKTRASSCIVYSSRAYLGPAALRAAVSLTQRPRRSVMPTAGASASGPESIGTVRRSVRLSRGQGCGLFAQLAAAEPSPSAPSLPEPHARVPFPRLHPLPPYRQEFGCSRMDAGIRAVPALRSCRA